MRQITERIEQLKKEYQTGQQQLNDLEERKKTLQTILLRISGAIQVLEELKNEEDSQEPSEK